MLNAEDNSPSGILHAAAAAAAAAGVSVPTVVPMLVPSYSLLQCPRLPFALIPRRSREGVSRQHYGRVPPLKCARVRVSVSACQLLCVRVGVRVSTEEKSI